MPHHSIETRSKKSHRQKKKNKRPLAAHTMGMTRNPGRLRLSIRTVVIGDGDGALGGDLEGLVVAAVLLSLLRHQAHVAHVAHGGHVELCERKEKKQAEVKREM